MHLMGIYFESSVVEEIIERLYSPRPIAAESLRMTTESPLADL